MDTGELSSQTISHVTLTNSTALIGHFKTLPAELNDVNEQRWKVLDSLRLTDPADDRNELQSHKGRRVPGTCQWIQEDPAYQQLFQEDSKPIWISGGPGKGKTMLSIFLTEALEKHTQDNKGLLTYYFCRHDDEKRNTEMSVLRGLLYKLVQTVSLATFRQHVRSSFATEASTNYALTNPETIWSIFCSIVKAGDPGPTYCVIDGLDECDKDSSKRITRRFHDLCTNATESASTFKLVIASRDSPTLRFTTISLDRHNSHIRHDIALFISRNIEDVLSHRDGFDDKKFLEEVSKRLHLGSEGTFLWIGLVVNDLSECETPREVTKTLDRAPNGLEPLYTRILHQIYMRHQEDSQRILCLLTWVSLAFRPLSRLELTHAVMGSASVKDQQTFDDLLIYCKHLLAVGDRTQTVRLVHASAKEFLVRLPVTVLSNTAPNRTHIDYGHHMILGKCLTLLERNKDDDSLTEYALGQWPQHMKACMPEHAAGELSRPFFQHEANVQHHWIRWRLLSGTDTYLPTTVPNAFHAAVYWGITPLAEKLISKPSTFWDLVTRHSYLDVRDKMGSTPLMVAVENQDLHMVKLLLQRGAAVTLEPDTDTSRPNDYRSALSIAIYCVDADFDPDEELDQSWLSVIILRLLLGHLRKPTCLSMITSFEFRRACAAKAGQELVEMFLECFPEFEITQTTLFECTALVAAARKGHATVVKFLLGCGADPESILNKQDAFYATIMSNNPRNAETILGMLLEKYDTKLKSMRAKDQRHVLLRPIDDEYFRQYHNNMSKRHEHSQNLDIWRLQKKRTTLFVAVSNNRCVKFCLERSQVGRFSPSGYTGGPELIQSLIDGNLPAAQILLDNGASVNTVNCYGSSVLISATKYGDWDEAEFLLLRGAEVNFVGYKKTTPLIEAVEEKHFEYKMWSKEDWTGTETRIISYWHSFRLKKLQLVSNLLNRGALTHCSTSDGRTALSVAANLGDAEMVEILVDHGARITMEDEMPERGLWRWYVTLYWLRKRGKIPSPRYERLLYFRIRLLSRKRRLSVLGKGWEYISKRPALDVHGELDSWEPMMMNRKASFPNRIECICW